MGIEENGQRRQPTIRGPFPQTSRPIQKLKSNLNKITAPLLIKQIFKNDSFLQYTVINLLRFLQVNNTDNNILIIEIEKELCELF